ncbi:MAG: LysR family transcriptional regulator [Acidocella sp. 20-61-6]|nr:MAG: LysR family transcriptional regulator [Acidocella sp. 20-61-6]
MAVAEREHVTRAAEALNLTQSAASAAIAGLEQQFGLKLFDRIGRGIVLTEAGSLLLGEARATLARAHAAEIAMMEQAGLNRGRLTLCASQTISSYFLPRKLVKFHAQYPGIELIVSVGNTAQVARAVQDGAAEIGFVEGPVTDPNLAVEAVGVDQMIVVVPPGHRWAGQTHIPTRELAEENWISREEGSGTRDAFVRALEALGLPANKLHISISLPSNEAVRAAVEEGAGAAALSSLVCAESLKTKALAQANLTLPARTFSAVQHNQRYRSRAAAALLATIRQ